MSLAHITGQTVAIRTLRNFIARGAVPHALLFHGPEGCGKAAAARAFAQAVNCRASVDGDACGECSSCRRIEKGADADVREFAPEKNEYVVDEAKRMLETASLTSGGGARKFLIIDRADVFNVEAANKMLKGLEEPAPSTVYVLIAAAPFKLLPTIRSRTVQIPFRALSVEEAAAVMKKNGVETDSARLAVIHKLAEGNVGEMIALATQPELSGLIAEAETFFESNLLAATTATPSCVADRMVKLASRFPAGRAATDAQARRNEAVLMLETLLLFMRRRLRGRIESGGAANAAPAARLMERVLETIRSIEGNANPQLALEMLALRFMKTEQGAA